MLFDHDFTDMNSDSQPHRMRACLRLSPQSRLELQGKPGRIRGLHKYDEERIPRRFNLLAFFELTEQFPNERPMLLHEHCAFTISERLLDLSGANDIGEKQGDQASPISPPEFLHLRAVLEG